MATSNSAALILFAKRLCSRSYLTSEEENALLALKGEVKQVLAHVDLVGQGETVDHSCLIVNGLVGRFGQNGRGSRQITCLYIPGDMADLTSIVSPRSGSGLVALTNTTILRFAHVDLRRIAADYPGIAEAFWRDCVADGSIISEWVVNVGSRDGSVRIAHLFCEMAVRFEQSAQGNKQSFPLAINQHDLGDATGMTNVHANRMLRELRTRSIASLGAGRVTVPNWEALVIAGDFDPGFLLLERLSSQTARQRGHSAS